MNVPTESEFRAPVMTWLAAIGSFLFVCVGLLLVALGMSFLAAGGPMLLAIGGIALAAPVLGLLSAWQAFKASRRQAYERMLVRASAAAPPANTANRVLAALAGVFGGAAVLGTIMFLATDLRDRLSMAVAGAIGGAAFGGLLVRTFLPPLPAVVLVTSVCPNCGERMAGRGDICPVCGAALVQDRQDRDA